MFKTFDLSRDLANQLSTVNEVLSFLPGIFTGSGTNENNIKKYSHWLSSSSSGSYYHGIYSADYTTVNTEELVDVTYGLSISSSFYSTTHRTNTAEKNRVYKLFAKQLLGSETSLFTIDGTIRNELIFLAIRRSQYKDEIQKASVSLNTMFSGAGSGVSNTEFDNITFTDANADNVYEQTNRGDVGELFTASSGGNVVGGLVYYNAGVLVLIPEVISCTSSVTTNVGNTWSGSFDYRAMAVSGGGGNFDNLIDSIRYRLINLTFVNQSNLHSTFYFCRALNDEFNYSSNPTFSDSGGRIIVNSGNVALTTRTYITKVGLMGENSEVLAVASLSQPLKKTPDNELIIKVRLDY